MRLSALNIKTHDGNYIDLFTLKNINWFFLTFCLFIYLFFVLFFVFLFVLCVCVCVLRRDILITL